MKPLQHHADAPLSTLDKGVPPLAAPLPIGEVASRGWNVLAEDIPLPCAVLIEGAMRNNSNWMKGFLETANAELAPHGKTTMAPAIFQLQIDDGAWGITVSTPHQLRVARHFGYNRIFYANQLVGKAAISHVIDEVARDPSFEFLFLIDSMDNFDAIESAAAAAGATRPLTALVELGYQGGRTGCRTKEEAVALARAIHGSRFMDLVGIEGFEGLLKAGSNEETWTLVGDLLDRLVDLARECDRLGLFAPGDIHLSAGGSAFYDIVTSKLGAANLSRPTTVLLRSGCYITHDSVMYAKAMQALRDRGNIDLPPGGPQPALEIWAYVQSRPEIDKLIATLGKRDISYDDQPVLLKWYRPDGSMGAPTPISDGHVVTRLNDQHAHLSIPAHSPLRVGDLVCFGISHPCLTFDKWRVLHVVDDEYNVVSSIRTYF